MRVRSWWRVSRAATTYSRLDRRGAVRQRPPHHITVSSWPPKGRSRVGDALARSAGMLAALENGGCVIAGHLPELEAAMVSWQPGAHQPDEVAAAVIAFDVLYPAAGQRCAIAAPVGVLGGSGSSPERGRGGFIDRLGSRRPMVEAMVGTAAATKSGDPEAIEEAEKQEAKVVKMSGYLSRRVDRRGSSPLGPTYDPMAGTGWSF